MQVSMRQIYIATKNTINLVPDFAIAAHIRSRNKSYTEYYAKYGHEQESIFPFVDNLSATGS